MNHGEQRRKFRAVLAGTRCSLAASLFDPLSARVAQAVGYEIGMLAGSVSSSTVLAAPDLCLQTLTEFGDQIRRVMRASTLSLLVDADHGYGNALNVMRTVQELEHAGVSGLMIEDTVTPLRFGQPEGSVELISREEMMGKLRAALAARQDPALVIAGRVAGLKAEDTARTAARASAYATTGIDAIYITGLKKLEDLDAIRAAAKLPIIVGTAPASFTPDILAPRGVRLLLQGHHPVAAAVQALTVTYTHLYNSGAPADLDARIAPAQEMERLVNGENYLKLRCEYLR